LLAFSAIARTAAIAAETGNSEGEAAAVGFIWTMSV
jgi:hypothetical protein